MSKLADLLRSFSVVVETFDPDQPRDEDGRFATKAAFKNVKTVGPVGDYSKLTPDQLDQIKAARASPADRAAVRARDQILAKRGLHAFNISPEVEQEIERAKEAARASVTVVDMEQCLVLALNSKLSQPSGSVLNSARLSGLRRSWIS
jgi:hypothetical protein